MRVQIVAAALALTLGFAMGAGAANATVGLGNLAALKTPVGQNSPLLKVLFCRDPGYWWYRSHYGRSYHRHHRRHRVWHPTPSIK